MTRIVRAGPAIGPACVAGRLLAVRLARFAGRLTALCLAGLAGPALRIASVARGLITARLARLARRLALRSTGIAGPAAGIAGAGVALGAAGVEASGAAATAAAYAGKARILIACAATRTLGCTGGARRCPDARQRLGRGPELDIEIEFVGRFSGLMRLRPRHGSGDLGVAADEHLRAAQSSERRPFRWKLLAVNDVLFGDLDTTSHVEREVQQPIPFPRTATEQSNITAKGGRDLT